MERTVTMSMADYHALLEDQRNLKALKAGEGHLVRTVAFAVQHERTGLLMSTVELEELTEKGNKELAISVEYLREEIQRLTELLKHNSPWWWWF